MAATLFLSAAPVPYSRPKISSSVLSVQNILGFAKSLQRSRLRNYHTIGQSHAPRVPYQRKYDDEDQYVLFCNGRAAVYKEFAEYLNRVWMQRSRLINYHTIGRSHAPRVPHQRKYDDEDRVYLWKAAHTQNL